jgi:peptidoglycan/LPS O-acetylase OafA/YrhL
MPRYRSLDVWRGIACLMIVVFHQTTLLTRWGQDKEFMAAAGLTSKTFLSIAAQMNLGVPMFFVISGYCVTASADNLRGSNADLKTFFWRRFHRIFPPYWAAVGLALFLYFASSMFGHPIYDGRLDPTNLPDRLTAWNWLGTLTLTEGWRHHFIGGDNRWLLTHAWSLGYEEQFYAVTGLILGYLSRKFFAGLAAVTAGVVVVAVVFGERLDGFFLDGSWVLFALGLLAYYWATLKEPRRKHRIILGLTLVLGTAVLGVLAGLPFFFACLFAAVIIGLRRFDDRLIRSAVLRPFLWVGRISYSLYLTHVLAVVAIHELVVPKIRSTWPASVMIAVVTSLAIGVSVCLAWLFHTYVERRFLAPSTQQPNVRYAASTSASVVAPHVLPLSGSINPQASARSGAT